MSEPLVVLFVPGVTPGKWSRIWAERMPRRPLELTPASADDARAALRAGSAHMAFMRDVTADDEFHVIPLYREQPVVVAARDSLVGALESVTLADLADEHRVEGEDAATIELVATGTAVAIMPQSVARARSRRDVVARPVTDAPDSGIGLIWRVDAEHPLIDTFIGIVRGRTANSSR